MTRTISLTSKNQITLPAKLVRQAGFVKGTRFLPQLLDGTIVLEPEQELRTTVKSIQDKLRPLVAQPLSDADLKKALHDWSQ